MNPISNGKLSPGCTFYIDQIHQRKDARTEGRQNLNNDKLMVDDLPPLDMFLTIFSTFLFPKTLR